MTTPKKSVADELIESMTEFAEAIESDKPLEAHLTGHTLRDGIAVETKDGDFAPDVKMPPRH